MGRRCSDHFSVWCVGVAVRFVGADNNELPVDARDLFGVKSGDSVVIRGIASFNPKLALPIIQLQADGIYICK